MACFPTLMPPHSSFASPFSIANRYPSLFASTVHLPSPPKNSNSTVVSPTNSSSLPSPTTPPKNQNANNSPPLAPLFNKLVIGNNGNFVQPSSSEMSPLQHMQLFQQQFFGSVSTNNNTSPVNKFSKEPIVNNGNLEAANEKRQAKKQN